MLAGAAAPPILALWASVLRRVDCETVEPVDDIRLTPEDGHLAVAQCKRTIDLSTSADSELAKTAAQFVNHHRQEGHADDNLVLITTSEASGRVTNTLRSVLDPNS